MRAARRWHFLIEPSVSPSSSASLPSGPELTVQSVKTRSCKSLELLVENLGGLVHRATPSDWRAKLSSTTARCCLPDLPAVMQAKYELLNRGGVLAFEYDTAQFADLGGMTRLKEWLRLRKPALRRQRASASRRPKGVLLLGVQGCGKSVAGQACRRHLRRAAAPARTSATIHEQVHRRVGAQPARVADDGRNDVAMRAVDRRDRERRRPSATATTAPRGDSSARFLTWLAEKKSRVFVVADGKRYLFACRRSWYERDVWTRFSSSTCRAPRSAKTF